MEYLKGYDLYKIITLKKYTRFDEKDMCEIIQQSLKALSFIHSQNIIHHDIKPENVLFANKRDYSTLKLIDFGLAAKIKRHKISCTILYVLRNDRWGFCPIIRYMVNWKYSLFEAYREICI